MNKFHQLARDQRLMLITVTLVATFIILLFVVLTATIPYVSIENQNQVAVCGSFLVALLPLMAKNIKMSLWRLACNIDSKLVVQPKA